MSNAQEFGDYLFEYPYQGSRWGFTIKASSQADAQARFRALAWAEFKGGPCETVSALSPKGVLVPLIVWWRNRFSEMQSKKKSYELEAMLAGMTEANLHEEIDLSSIPQQSVDPNGKTAHPR